MLYQLEHLLMYTQKTSGFVCGTFAFMMGYLLHTISRQHILSTSSAMLFIRYSLHAKGPRDYLLYRWIV